MFFGNEHNAKVFTNTYQQIKIHKFSQNNESTNWTKIHKNVKRKQM